MNVTTNTTTKNLATKEHEITRKIKIKISVCHNFYKNDFVTGFAR